MSLKDDLRKMVEEGNVAKTDHLRDVDSPGGLHQSVVWLNDRVRADFKAFLAKQMLSDLNTNDPKTVAKCHFDVFMEQILSNEHQCQSSDKFLDALCEAKRAVLCDMAAFLRPYANQTS
jgi:hypothetical protein